MDISLKKLNKNEDEEKQLKCFCEELNCHILCDGICKDCKAFEIFDFGLVD